MRLRPRFGLRAQLTVITIICCLSAAVAFWYRSQQAIHRRQEQLAEEYRKYAASVTWEQQTPKWLSWLGDSSCFQRITAISFWRPDISKREQLTELTSLRKITMLVPEGKLTNEIVDWLARVKPLTVLVVVFDYTDERMRGAAGGLFMRDRQDSLHKRLPGVRIQFTEERPGKRILFPP